MVNPNFDIYDEQKPKKPLINPIYAAALALATGALGLACALWVSYAAAIVFGAVGLFFGGNSFGHAVKVYAEEKNAVPALLSGAGLFMAVIAFIFGFAGALS